MELIAQYLGRDLVTFINPEDRVQDLTPAQRLEGLSDEDRQALLQLWANQEDLTPAQRMMLPSDFKAWMLPSDFKACHLKIYVTA
jgi:hypothetical protein